MAENGHNSGFVNTGKMNVGSGAFGAGAVYVNAPEAQPEKAPPKPGATDVGIITVLSEEARAIRDELGLDPGHTGSPGFELGCIAAGGQPFTVAAVRALDQGEGPAISAFHHLREHHTPRLVVLAGIAGGMPRRIHIGDVVISTRVIYYDLRKETPDGTVRRGQERQAPAWIGHAINRFFTDHGEPARFRGQRRSFQVLSGPIASGNVVIADRDSEILQYLARYNDKILAVDMEAGGLSQACHDQPATTQHTQGWVIVRGISDDASQDKNDDHHHTAARHAAIVVGELLPYLLPGPV